MAAKTVSKTNVKKTVTTTATASKKLSAKKKAPTKSKLEIVVARRKRLDSVLETFDQYKETGDADFDKALKNATQLLKRYDRLLERRATRLEDED